MTRWKLLFEKQNESLLLENVTVTSNDIIDNKITSSTDAEDFCKTEQSYEFNIVCSSKECNSTVNKLENENKSCDKTYTTFSNTEPNSTTSEVIYYSKSETENCDSSVSQVPGSNDDENSVKDAYECLNCNNFYTSLKNFKFHLKYCSGKINLPENGAAKLTYTKARGRKSLRTFVCDICKETFNKVQLIKDHYTSVHSYNLKDIKPFSCDRCEQKFSTVSLLYQHVKYHVKDRSKMCTTCGKSFITSNDLMSHQYIHLNRRNYRCNDCDKAFNTNKNLRTHILVVHTDRSLWRYHCTICDKRFPQKSNYDQHSKRHNGDKQHVCHFCQKPFISFSELKRHIYLHSNIKLFKCNICDTEYKYQRSYKQHVDRKHSNGEQKICITKQKKFVCHICPSQFYDRAKLLRHLSKHSGVKPHTCVFCDKNFAEKAYLKQHLKLIHGNN